jgi:hypothetical protein
LDDGKFHFHIPGSITTPEDLWIKYVETAAEKIEGNAGIFLVQVALKRVTRLLRDAGILLVQNI